MITFAFDASDLAAALEAVGDNLRRDLPTGMEVLCESVASRARREHSWRDRSGQLTSSTQSAGVEEQSGDYIGTVSFAARAKTSRKYPQGYLYGLVQEFGNRAGTVKGSRFITNALKAQDSRPLEDALERSFAAAGFRVVR